METTKLANSQIYTLQTQTNRWSDNISTFEEEQKGKSNGQRFQANAETFNDQTESTVRMISDCRFDSTPLKWIFRFDFHENSNSPNLTVGAQTIRGSSLCRWFFDCDSKVMRRYFISFECCARKRCENRSPFSAFLSLFTVCVAHISMEANLTR